MEYTPLQQLYLYYCAETAISPTRNRASNYSTPPQHQATTSSEAENSLQFVSGDRHGTEAATTMTTTGKNHRKQQRHPIKSILHTLIPTIEEHILSMFSAYAADSVPMSNTLVEFPLLNLDFERHYLGNDGASVLLQTLTAWGDEHQMFLAETRYQFEREREMGEGIEKADEGKKGGEKKETVTQKQNTYAFLDFYLPKQWKGKVQPKQQKSNEEAVEQHDKPSSCIWCLDPLSSFLLPIQVLRCPKCGLSNESMSSVCAFLLSRHGRNIVELDLSGNEFLALESGQMLLRALTHILEQFEEAAKKGKEKDGYYHRLQKVSLEGTNIPPHYIRRIHKLVEAISALRR